MLGFDPVIKAMDSMFSFSFFIYVRLRKKISGKNNPLENTRTRKVQEAVEITSNHKLHMKAAWISDYNI